MLFKRNRISTFQKCYATYNCYSLERTITYLVSWFEAVQLQIPYHHNHSASKNKFSKSIE